MNLDFRWKFNVLRRVAPPVRVKNAAPRGPFLAVEGDSLDAVKQVGTWLNNTLRKDSDLAVTLLDSPALSDEDGKEALMAAHHHLVAEWLAKSGRIKNSLVMNAISSIDAVMVNASQAPMATPQTSRQIEETYDDGDDSSTQSQMLVIASADKPREPERTNPETEKMDVDRSAASSPTSKEAQPNKTTSSANSAKPVGIVANYSIQASNFYACRIPFDHYDPEAHWSWTATQWRGIISPDLTIYVRDAVAGDNGKLSVDIMEEGSLFVVKRNKVDGQDVMEVEPSAQRRLGFEVSEWVRAFGVEAE